MWSRCIFRGFSTATKELPSGASPMFENRNPRNLERLRIGYRPDGFHLEKKGRNFWHKLELKETGRYVVAKVVHFENGPVIEASTNEWAIKKHLYRYRDTSAYINLGRVLADRCLKFGIIEMRCDLKNAPGEKIKKFLEHMAEGGVVLKEEKRYIHPLPWGPRRVEKPWEIHE